MINNLIYILPILDFESEDTFYHLQIIKRKKEHKDLGSNSLIVKTYYISSADYLEKRMGEIIALCDFHNARACINLNRRSFEKMAFHLMRKVCDQILAKDFRSARKAYESVCGTYSDEHTKKWIIDIDEKSFKLLSEIEEFIQTCEPNVGESKKVITLETKSGYHLITTPFRLDVFKAKYPEIEVHKDNPTILYIP